MTFGLYIQDLTNGEVIYHKEGDVYSLMGWSSKNFPLLYDGGQLFELAFIVDSLKEINLAIEQNKFRLNEIKVETDSSVIMLLDSLQKDSKTKLYNTQTREIGRYHLKTGEIDWLTRDGYKKSNLDIYIKK